MTFSKVSCLPLLDEDEQVVGIVTKNDVLDAVAERAKNYMEVLELPVKVTVPAFYDTKSVCLVNYTTQLAGVLRHAREHCRRGDPCADGRLHELRLHPSRPVAAGSGLLLGHHGLHPQLVDRGQLSRRRRSLLPHFSGFSSRSGVRITDFVAHAPRSVVSQKSNNFRTNWTTRPRGSIGVN